jgi:methylenetetrahydrofolate dehydrogenase (NADP+) / methenyltetrahydrofolate cyclohydrolase
MTARLIDGREIARAIKEKVREEVKALSPARVTLAAIAAEGAPGGVDVYAANQKKQAESLGIAFRQVLLPSDAGPERLKETIDGLNEDRNVHGILLFRPLPEGTDPVGAAAYIHPDKDVEGMHPANLGRLLYGRDGLIPCTALAAVTLIESTGIGMEGLETVVVGHSEIVGKPIALLLVNALSTVTTCHIATKNLAAHTCQADILCCAAGVPGLITGNMVKPGAVVIDIGINRIKIDEGGVSRRKVVGDVDFPSVENVAGWLTPVPGGVGPVTTAVLMQNTAHAARRALDS